MASKFGGKLFTTLKITGTILVIALLILAALYPVLSRPGMAAGADTGVHIYIPTYIVDYVQKNFKLPQINPYWYNDFEIVHSIPPTAYILIGLIYLFIKDVVLLSKFTHFFLLFLVALIMFGVVYKKGGQVFPAFLGAILFTFSPIVFFQITGAGSYPRVASLMLIPLCFYYTEELLENKRKYSKAAILSLLFSLTLLGHPMTGGVIILFLSLYALARIVLDKDVSSHSFPCLLLTLILTLMLSAWYLLPFKVEQVGWGFVVPEAVLKIGSVPPLKMLSWLGFFSLPLALITLYLHRSTGTKALFVVGILTLPFAAGVYFPLNKSLPFQSTYPFLGLIFGAFCFSYLAATGLNFNLLRAFGKKVIPFAITFVLITVSLYVYRGYKESLRGIDVSVEFKVPATVKASKKLQDFSNKGRLMLMKYPFDFILWWIPKLAKKPMIEGWYYSITPTGKYIAWMYDAIDYGYPKYTINQLTYRNVRYLLTNTNFVGPQYEYFLSQMLKKGFKQVYKNEAYTLYFNARKPTYFLPLKERVLAIGKHASQVTPLIPAVQGTSIYLEDYDWEVLKYFDTLVLYGFAFRNKAKAEELIRKYVKKGGKVVINFNGAEKTLLEENPNFLGVTAYPIVADGPIFIETTDASYNYLIPSQFDLPSELENGENRVPLESFQFFKYLGLDQSLARIKGEKQPYGIIGYKRVENKPVFFVGPNLFYHAYLTHNKRELKLIENLVSPNKAATLHRKEAKVKLKVQSSTPEYHKFRYSATEEVPLLASFTYSPHWKAYLDREKIKIYNLEDLMFLSLPAGNHQVEMKYEGTPIHFYGDGLSLLTLLFLGFLIYKDRRKTD